MKIGELHQAVLMLEKVSKRHNAVDESQMLLELADVLAPYKDDTMAKFLKKVTPKTVVKRKAKAPQRKISRRQRIVAKKR